MDIIHVYHPCISSMHVIRRYYPWISSMEIIHGYHPWIISIDITHGIPWGVPWDPRGGTMGTPWVGSISLLGLMRPQGLMGPQGSQGNGAPGMPGGRLPQCPDPR